MALVGITGGPAAGKSSVLQRLEGLGARVVDSDRIVHDIYRDDDGLQESLRRRWGPDAFRESGAVDRAWVAGKVFASAAEREWLNAQIHPRVQNQLLELEKEYSPEPVYCAVPLLYEVGWQGMMAAVCAVWCSPERQTARLRRRGWSDERIRQCMQAQMPPEDKLERADFGLINSGTKQALHDQCRRVLRRIQALLETSVDTSH